MSERLTRCIKCGTSNLTTLKIINPDTTDMNMKAKLKCDECSHMAIYDVMSNHFKIKRSRGFIR